MVTTNNPKSFAKLNISSFEKLASNKKMHNATILYTTITVRANFSANNEAYIGDCENIGLTRSQYRTAKDKLVHLGYIKTYSKPRVGTIAILLK